MKLENWNDTGIWELGMENYLKMSLKFGIILILQR